MNKSPDSWSPNPKFDWREHEEKHKRRKEKYRSNCLKIAEDYNPKKRALVDKYISKYKEKGITVVVEEVYDKREADFWYVVTGYESKRYDSKKKEHRYSDLERLDTIFYFIDIEYGIDLVFDFVAEREKLWKDFVLTL